MVSFTPASALVGSTIFGIKRTGAWLSQAPDPSRCLTFKLNRQVEAQITPYCHVLDHTSKSETIVLTLTYNSLLVLHNKNSVFASRHVLNVRAAHVNKCLRLPFLLTFSLGFLPQISGLEFSCKKVGLAELLPFINFFYQKKRNH